MKKESKSFYGPITKIISALLAALTVFSSGIIVSYAEGLGAFDAIETQNILSDSVEDMIDLSGVKTINKEKTGGNELYLNMKDGSTTVYSFSEPITYTDENGNLKCKSISISDLDDEDINALGYDYGNEQNDYKIYFSSDSSKGVLVEYADFAFSMAPVSESSAPGYISQGEINGEKFENFEYADLYGYGTYLKYFPQFNGVKEEIVLDEKINRNTFSFGFKTKNCVPVLHDDASISLVNSENETVQTFAAPFAYDAEYVEGVSDEHYSSDCAYSLEKTGENEYILTLTVSSDWLNADSTVYPVTIDPTTANLQTNMDLPIHSSRTTSGTQNDNNAVGTSSQYGTSRTLVFMKLPQEISQYAKINSAYYYARELTGRTSNMNVNVHKVTSQWNNYSSWASRPDWDPKVLDTVNINGNYNGVGAYWYKFDISSVVQSHANGGDNKGFMLKTADESGAANLRTFAQTEYATSSMRPYIVINYTNDTTAPTVTSVTKSPADTWSSGSVTIAVNGAQDSGSGLAAEAYSFSTDPYVFNWQSGNTYVAASSCHVWIHVRDKAGNSNYCACVRVDIDRKAPEITGVAKADNGNTVTVTVTAQDADSGVSGYSFDGGKTWQSSSSADLSIKIKPVIQVKDAAGNITEYKESAAPEIYTDNGLVYIYTVGSAEYKIADGSWQTYSHPFSVPVGEETIVYARDKSCPSSQVSKTVNNTIGEYAQSVTDMSISYYNASFDISRSYNSNSGWFNSLESKIDLSVSTDNVIYALMPYGTLLAFEKTLSSNVFVNKSTDYILTKSGNTYIISAGGNDYTYDSAGVLSSVSDLSGNIITFAKNADDKITSVTAGDGHYTQWRIIRTALFRA